MKATIPTNKPGAAFTLIEVMIALGIFFMAVFTILGVISSGLSNARSFSKKVVSAGQITPLVITNRALVEGIDKIDTTELEKMFPDYRWHTDTEEISSNHLYEVDTVVQKEFGKGNPDTLSLLQWSPDSPAGSLDGGIGGHP